MAGTLAQLPWAVNSQQVKWKSPNISLYYSELRTHLSPEISLEMPKIREYTKAETY